MSDGKVAVDYECRQSKGYVRRQAFFTAVEVLLLLVVSLFLVFLPFGREDEMFYLSELGAPQLIVHCMLACACLFIAVRLLLRFRNTLKYPRSLSVNAAGVIHSNGVRCCWGDVRRIWMDWMIVEHERTAGRGLGRMIVLGYENTLTGHLVIESTCGGVIQIDLLDLDYDVDELIRAIGSHVADGVFDDKLTAINRCKTIAAD